MFIKVCDTFVLCIELACLPVTQVAEKTKPAVVMIERLVFDEYEQATVPKLLGGGVLVSRQGHILTCAHVLKHERVVRVRMWDGASAKARVLDVDASSDLALLQLLRYPKETPFVEFGSRAKLGDSIFVVGHPAGVSWNITSGVITHLTETLLQSDAAVYPGSSGGGAFNTDGKLIALTQAMVEKPSSTAESILIDGRVCRRFCQRHVESEYRPICRTQWPAARTLPIMCAVGRSQRPDMQDEMAVWMGRG